MSALIGAKARLRAFRGQRPPPPHAPSVRVGSPGPSHSIPRWVGVRVRDPGGTASSACWCAEASTKVQSEHGSPGHPAPGMECAWDAGPGGATTGAGGHSQRRRQWPWARRPEFEYRLWVYLLVSQGLGALPCERGFDAACSAPALGLAEEPGCAEWSYF